MQKSKKGHNSAMMSDGKENIQVRLSFMLIPCIKFQDPIIVYSIPDAPTDEQTGLNQYTPSTSSMLGA